MKKATILFLFLSLILSFSLTSQNVCDDNSIRWSGGGNTITNPNTNSIGTCNNFDLLLKVNDTSRVTIKTDGRLLVGRKNILKNHIHGNSFMQVDGKLACKELVVVDPSKWADFVFSPQYKLKPLNEVEDFYKLNGHLPDVPSEKDVMQNGINTAEMDAVLLQKIEELTLYIVEINKKVEALVKENEALKGLLTTH